MSLDLPGIFLAGVLTFLSPCVLPLIPLYLSFLAGVSIGQVREGGGRAPRPLGVALAFSLGLGAVFVALGLAATAVGGALAEHRVRLLQFGGLALLLMGLKQLGLIEVPLLNREGRPWLGRVRQGGSVVSAFLFGAAFALGWTPCIGPVLGAVLTYTAASTAEPARGALYLGTYALGLSVPLLGVAAAAPLALRWMDRAKRHLRTFERTTGALLAVLGLLLFTDSLDALVPPAGGPEQPVAAAVAPPASPDTPAPAASAPAEGATCAPGAGGDGTCALPEDALAQPATAGGSPVLAALERPTMVEFVSHTCTVCQRMEPVVALAEHSCAGQGVGVLRLDVGTPEGRQAAARFGVRGVPTFLFLDGNGREVGRRIGEQPLASLQQGLESIAGVRCAGLLPGAGGAAATPPPAGTGS